MGLGDPLVAAISEARHGDRLGRVKAPRRGPPVADVPAAPAARILPEPPVHRSPATLPLDESSKSVAYPQCEALDTPRRFGIGRAILFAAPVNALLWYLAYRYLF
jgi:hypothetical protein